MTVVNIATGEVVDLDAPAAERRAERITLRLDAIADNYRAVLPMIREAIEKRDDLALGYRSPGDYVSDRFGQALAGLGIEVRRAVVGELTAAGLSTRAIAPVVGVSNYTVHQDQAAVRDITPEPDPGPCDESDHGQHFAVLHPDGTDEMCSHVAAVSEPEPIALPTVTGIDGKTYTRPTPTAVVPRKDAEIYLNAAETFAAKAAREAAKLTPAQIARVRGEADHWTASLSDSVETLQRLLTSLNKEK